MKSRQRKQEGTHCRTHDTAQRAFCCAKTPFEGLQYFPMDFLPLVTESEHQYILFKRLPLSLF